MAQLIQNAVYVPSLRKFFRSKHQHDWVGFVVKGQNHFIDGGNAYVRRSFMDSKDIVDCTLDVDSSENDIRMKLLWGTYGKKGDKPLTWKPIHRLSKPHLQALLDTQPLSPLCRSVVKFWLDAKTNKKTSKE